MKLMICLINYDIEQNKLRTALAKRLQYFGFSRIQKSLFVGSIASNNLRKLKIELKKMPWQENDKCMITIVSKKAI